MGTIKKQSLFSTVWVYIGVAIGFANSAVAFPNLLTPEQIGALSFLNSASAILAAFFSLGIPLLLINSFPKHQSESASNPLSGFALLGSIGGIIMAIGTYYLLQSHLLPDKFSSIIPAIFLSAGILVAVSFRIVFNNLDTYIRMLENAVLGIFTENILLKIAITAILLVSWLTEAISFKVILILYAFALALPGIVSLIYSFSKKAIKIDWAYFKLLSKTEKKEIAKLMLFGTIGALGGAFMFEIDRIMISSILGFEENGIYTTSFYFGILISVPARGLKKISSRFIAEAWNRNDLSQVKDIYYRSSINLNIIATFLFLGLLFSLDFVYLFLPETYQQGRLVVILIAFSQLLDLSFGLNSEIIFGGKEYYKVLIYSVAMMFLMITLNVIFIAQWQIEGAAIASLISILIFNLLKYNHLRNKLKFQPFNAQIVKVIFLSIACYFIVNQLDLFSDVIGNFFFQTSLLSLIFWTLIYLFRISEDVNELAIELAKKGKNILFKS